MHLPESRELLPRVEWFEAVGSTNAALRELVEREKASGRATAHGTVIATADQTAGRGRQGRGWVTPPGTAIAMSVLIRSKEDRALPLSWLPLLAGSAVTAALRPLLPEETGLRPGVKWPNDVHLRGEQDAEDGVPGKKICGILCEATPAAHGDDAGFSVIVGMGVNLLIDEHDLPTDRATSLLAAGGEVNGALNLSDEPGQQLVDLVLSGIASELLELVELAGSEAGAELARNRVLRDSFTLGSEVRVHLPGGETVDGRAVALADDGALIVDRPTTGQLIVNAADVEHLRTPH